ncbi:hypothetical protein [Lysobacter humi (ex Lee et al. 2017)]
MNWKKGLTRLYMVLWALWVALLGGYAALNSHPGDGAIGWTVFAWLGLAIPAILLVALRWVLSGFTGPRADG